MILKSRIKYGITCMHVHIYENIIKLYFRNIIYEYIFLPNNFKTLKI